MTDRAREVIGWAGPAAVHVDTETGVARFHVDEFLAALEAEGLAVLSADEVEARIAEAVAAERLRAERLCQALRYRMNASDFDQLIVAIRGGNHDG